MSIAEVAIKVCREEPSYSLSDHDYYKFVTRCYHNISFGVGIWCSVIVSLFESNLYASFIIKIRILEQNYYILKVIRFYK